MFFDQTILFLTFYTQRDRPRLSTLITTLHSIFVGIVESTSGLLLLNRICLSLLIQCSHGDEHRLNYDIKDVQLASAIWIHTWKIDIPEEIRIQTINYYDYRSSAASLNNVMFQIKAKANNATTHEYDPKTNFQPYTRLTCGNRAFQVRVATIYWGYRERSIWTSIARRLMFFLHNTLMD